MRLIDFARQNFLKRPDLSGLPPRVRARIAEREWANELLLRSIQLAIILIFCFIYTISPKTYPDGTTAPVPYVLGAYLVLATIGLIWGWMREPPDWAGYVSILFDFCLLYGLMISFHIQYGQPASFILKAPSLLYVFIFIAIRALRFHPKFVLMAGSVAMLGWAFVIVYVTRIDPGDNMLTRSYIQYLTSNSILIGAEVDKILSIGFVTAILGLAVNGSSNLLVTAVAEQSAAADLSRFFDSSVAKGIRTAEALEAGHGEKRFATILNVDLRGFTNLAARLDADAVMRLLSAYQACVIPLVQQNNGIIDKFMGDGIMASFGIAGRNGEEGGSEADAIRTAEAILLDADQWAGRWAAEAPALGGIGPVMVGIGIASGTVNWGAVGGPAGNTDQGDRLEMTVIGPAVNLSAKLEKHNKKLSSRCVVEASTWKRAQEQGYDGVLEAKMKNARVEGVSEPLEIAVLSLRTVEMPKITERQKAEPVSSSARRKADS